MGLRIKFDFSEALKGSMRVIKGVEQGAEDGIREATERVFMKSQVQVPVKTGVLKQSGKIRYWANKYQKGANITYGPGGAETYAIPVHENLYSHHPNGKAKYLEDPMREEQQLFNQTLIENINRRLPK